METLNKFKFCTILARLESGNTYVYIRRKSSVRTYSSRKIFIQQVIACSSNRAKELDEETRDFVDIFTKLTDEEKGRVYNWEYVEIKFNSIKAC